MSDQEIGPEQLVGPSKSSNSSFSNCSSENKQGFPNDIEEKYSQFPFVLSIIRGRETRHNAFDNNGHLIRHGVKSDYGWLRTVFLYKERAMDVYVIPWLLLTLNACVWTLITQIVYEDSDDNNNNNEETDNDGSEWDFFFSTVLTTSLAFLLVFRLNRVAVRWWDTRVMWGSMITQCRILSNSILEHVDHKPKYRDEAIGWVAAFLVATKQHIRRETSKLSPDELCGFVSSHDIQKLSLSKHPCIDAAYHLKHSLNAALNVTHDTPAGLGLAYTSQLRSMERIIDGLVQNMGGLERVRSTPLPIIIVTHLRTFLLGYLFSLPYFYAQEWKWQTIPLIALLGFALLGIDGAASECESPFQRDRLNHLDMESFCKTGLDDIEQLVILNADTRLKEGLENVKCIE